MEEKIQGIYESSLRFDEGELFQGEEYSRAEQTCIEIETLLQEMCGSQVLPLLQRYAEALYDITELEARHFFEQGYLAGSQTAGA